MAPNFHGYAQAPAGLLMFRPSPKTRSRISSASIRAPASRGRWRTEVTRARGRGARLLGLLKRFGQKEAWRCGALACGWCW